MLKKFSESLPYYCEFNPIDIIWGISKIYREKRKVLPHLKYEKDNLHVEQEILVVGKRTAQGQELNFLIFICAEDSDDSTDNDFEDDDNL